MDTPEKPITHRRSHKPPKPTFNLDLLFNKVHKPFVETESRPAPVPPVPSPDDRVNDCPKRAAFIDSIVARRRG